MNYRNTTHSVLLIVTSILLLLPLSCTDHFEELNRDEKAITTAEPSAIIAGAMKSFLDTYGGHMNSFVGLHNARYGGNVGGAASYNFWTNDANNRGYWNTFYTGVLANLDQVVELYGDNENYRNRVYIAKTLKAYTFATLATVYGMVPMSEALSGKENVPYDTEEEIYTLVLATLKEAGQNMTTDGDFLAKDPLFDGDMMKWIKFANTLRLKIALRISTGFPELAEQHVREVMANENMLIENNSENAAISWGTEQENWSFFYENVVFQGRQVNFLPKMNHMFMLYMKTYNDPRVDVYADPAKDPLQFNDSLYVDETRQEKKSVTYHIPHLGEPIAGSFVLPAWNLQANNNPLQDLGDDNYSVFDRENFMAQDMDFRLVTSAETKFMKAEAALKGWGGSKSAEQYYYEGIDDSFAQWGLLGVEDYKQQDGINWGTSNEGHWNFIQTNRSSISSDPFEKIAIQRWIAMFNQSVDMWAFQRRTRALDVPPHLNPSPLTEREYMAYMQRLGYSPDEPTVNSDAYSKAIQVQGPDATTTPLKINKSFTPKDWTAVSAEFTLDFASEYYGDTIEDLKDAGLVERTTPVTSDNPLKVDEYIIND